MKMSETTRALDRLTGEFKQFSENTQRQLDRIEKRVNGHYVKVEELAENQVRIEGQVDQLKDDSERIQTVEIPRATKLQINFNTVTNAGILLLEAVKRIFGL